MDGVQVNLWAVALAGLATMVIGSTWYTPKLFGNTWMKLARIDREKQAKGSFVPLAIAILGAFVTAYVIAHFAYISHTVSGNTFFVDALSVSFWGWLGFTALRFVMHDAFEGRPAKLTFINISHDLVAIMAMGAIIGGLGV